MADATCCASCRSELDPGDRFCPACGTPRPRLCPACATPLRPAARFCGRCGSRVEDGSPQAGVELPGLDAPTLDAPALDTPPGEPPEPEVPPSLREKFESVRAELQGDRREVVVLFADLSGFTALSETMDPESVTLLMNRLLQSLAGAVYEYEGYVDKFIGDAVMALFGAPLAHEDDCERAVLAALAMQDVVRRHNEAGEVQLALRVGINVGEVVAAHLGTSGRMQYTVLGDAVNVASRLEGRAESGRVLVSEAVYRRVEHRFDAAEVPPLTLKGKSEPVRGFEIGAVREARQAGRFAETPFVGREHELAELSEFLGRIATGRPGQLLLEGDAGGGKTRLVEVALDRTPHDLTRVTLRLTSIHLPGQRPAPSEIFHQLFHPGEGEPAGRAAALLGAQAARQRAGIDGLAGQATTGVVGGTPEEADPATARQNRWVAIAALLHAAARKRPVLLWIEDAHWMDEAAQEFMTFLLPAVAHAPIGVLVTGRPELTGEWIPAGIRRLTLSPLDDDAARALLGDLAEDLGVEGRHDLVRRSQGNPLYLEQLVRSLQEGRPGAQVPGTVQGLIMARIDQLEGATQTLLQMAAVLGTRFSTRLLRRMYGLEAQRTNFETAFGSLEAGGFVRIEDPERSVWGFRHALTQEVAYGGLLIRVRKVLHESAARLGEEVFAERREAEAPFFAHHYWRAGLAREAAPHLWIAGRAAAEAYELATAEEFLGRLAEALEKEAPELLSDEDRARFLEIYGNVLLYRGRLEDADERFRELEREGERRGRGEWVARGLEYRGRTAWYRGALDEAEASFERGLSRLPPGQDRIEADLHNALGIVYYYRGRPEDAFAQHAAALELRERIGDRLGMAKSYSNVGNLLADFRDDLEGAERHYRRGLEMAEAVGDRQMQYSTLFNLGTIVQDRGQWVEALEIFHRGERLLDEIGWSHAQYQNLQKQAECEIALGQVDRALRHLQLCLSAGDTVLEPVNRVNTRAFLFDAYLRLCMDAAAEAAIVDARHLVDELRVDEALESVLLREGRWHAAQGRWREAAVAFSAALDEARRRNHGSFAALAEAHHCRARARAGDLDVQPCVTELHGKTPVLTVIAYLNADTEAERAPTAGTASTLEGVADEAARLGDPGLERAAAERLADVWRARGNAAARRAAIERAARAMQALESGLSKDLAAEYAAHPRNAALRRAARTPDPQRGVAGA